MQKRLPKKGSMRNMPATNNVPEQTIMWTALPNGLITRAGKKKLKISLLVSPKLAYRSEKLCSDFLKWPDTVERIDFSLCFNDGNEIQEFPLPRSSIQLEHLDKKLWDAFFKGNSTYVRPYIPEDYSNRTILTDSMRSSQKLLKDLHCHSTFLRHKYLHQSHLKAHNQSINDVSAERFIKKVKTIQKYAEIWENTPKKPIIEKINKEQKGESNRHNDDKSILERHLLFYRRNARKRTHEPAKMDFHQAISMLSEYSMIMRMIGMIIDFEIDASEISPKIPAKGFLRLKPNMSAFIDTTTNNVAPWTAFNWNGTDNFEAASDPLRKDINRRMLNLRPDEYELMQANGGADLDNLIEYIRNWKLGQVDEHSGLYEFFDDFRPSSIRSGSLNLVREKKDIAIKQKLKNIYSLNNPDQANAEPHFYAEDLVRGYRIDIQDVDKGNWHSLCRREISYEIEGYSDNPIKIVDEGFVQTAMVQEETSENEDPESMPLLMTESIMKWDGWSLCLPKPGKGIASASAPMGEELEPPFKIKTSFSYPKKTAITFPKDLLPKLRFGNSYRVRARVVDLAGNSLSLDEASDPSQSNVSNILSNKQYFDIEFWQFSVLSRSPGGVPVTINSLDLNLSQLSFPGPSIKYLRFEPVNAPEVVLSESLNDRDKPGESLEHLVIRSRNTRPQLDILGTIETSQRHIAPPRTTRWMAELHGCFDGKDGRLRGRSGDDDGFYTNLLSSRAEKVPVGTLDSNGKPTTMVISYLPDPLSQSAMLRGLPGTETGTIGIEDDSHHLSYSMFTEIEENDMSMTHISFMDGCSWPEAKPFRLMLAEGSRHPHWDFTNRVLMVYLSKAEVMTIEVSSTLKLRDRNLIGILQWLGEWIDNEDIPNKGEFLSDLTIRASLGCLQMVTPSRILTLVHAVQQPLEHPRVDSLSAKRPSASLPGQTSIYLEGIVKVHGKSTSKVDIMAKWIEYVDQVDADGNWPKRIDCSAHVCEIPLGDLHSGELISGGSRVGFYDPASDTIAFQKIGTNVLESMLNGCPVHEFHDTKHRKVYYTFVATSRFREYFDKNQALDFTRTSDSVILSIPSTTRPASPRIAYVVPTYKWSSRNSTDIFTGDKIIESIRKGGGLRVYLEMDDWFSSGQDELLGVVLAQPDTLPNDIIKSNELRKKLKPYITQWGQDPIRDSEFISNVPLIEDFNPPQGESDNQMRVARDLLLHEADIEVSVAGYAVNYDAKKKLLYSDVEIHSSLMSYYPFIRLALARYQPDSIPGAHISRVVLADFAQLSPDRRALITYRPNNPQRVIVDITGPCYKKMPVNKDTMGNFGTLMDEVLQPDNKIELIIEEKRSDLPGDLGWVSKWSKELVNRQSLGNGDYKWHGDISLPKQFISGMFRLVIKEYEMLPVNKDSVDEWNEKSQGDLTILSEPFVAGKRLVYADAIILL